MKTLDLAPHLSYSQAACANRCPRQWSLKYIYGITTPASPAMEHGKAVDDLLSSWLQGFEPYSISTPPTEVMRDASALYEYAQDWDVVGVQTRHEGRIEGVEYPVIGYSDAILADGTIVDWKVSRQWRVDWKTQVSLYHLLPPLKDTPAFKGWTKIASLNADGVRAWPCRVARVYNGRVSLYEFEADLQAAVDYIRSGWAVMRGDVHPAVPSQACGWCGVAEECAVLNALEARRANYL